MGPGSWRRPLFFIVGIVGLLATLWCGAGFRKEGTPGVSLPDVPPQQATTPKPADDLSGGPSAASDETFGSKVNRGNQLLKGKPEEAARVLTEAMQMNPNDEDVHYNLGLALTKLGQFSKAIEQYEQALRIFPNYAEAHNNLGNVLMRSGRTEEAIAHFESAVKLMPAYASAHNNLGTALQHSGRVQEANTHFERAVQIDPQYWEARYNLALSCEQAGNLDRARRELEAVLRLRPQFEPAKMALREMVEHRAAPLP